MKTKSFLGEYIVKKTLLLSVTISKMIVVKTEPIHFNGKKCGPKEPVTLTMEYN
jgi:hypothetical protein